MQTSLSVRNVAELEKLIFFAEIRKGARVAEWKLN